MKDMIKTKRKYLLPLFHFLLSFLYERSFFLFASDEDIVLSIPRNQVISDAGERVLGYLISKLCAAVLIFFLWSLLFYVVENWRTKKNLRFFVGMFVVGLIGILLLWPDPFVASEDNFITYSYAIRFWPEYWHSAYTSCIYAAVLMVFPVPVFLTVFQWIFSVFMLGYLYNRIVDSPVLKGKGKYGVFLIFLMPGVYTLFTNAYRTEIYALFCMFLVARTAMDIVDQRKNELGELIGNMLLCGMAAVWRSEGIILGILLFALRLLLLYQWPPVKKVFCFLIMLCVFGLFLLPQKLGDIKYYGKDYSFINSFPTLRNILASPGANLAYEGAEEDIAALDAVVPADILRCYGMDGYRRYNYANGRLDINQSLAEDAAAKAYMSAYYRMTAHNLPIYMKTQIVMVLKALMIKPDEYVVGSEVKPEKDLPAWRLKVWDLGREDFYRAKGLAEWSGTAVHKGVSDLFNKVSGGIAGILQKIYFYSLLLVLIPLYEVFLFFREVVRAVKKKTNRWGLAGISFILLGQAAAICLVIPAGTLVYFHAYYYCSAILCVIDQSYVRSRKKDEVENCG